MACISIVKAVHSLWSMTGHHSVINEMVPPSVGAYYQWAASAPKGMKKTYGTLHVHWGTWVVLCCGALCSTVQCVRVPLHIDQVHCHALWQRVRFSVIFQNAQVWISSKTFHIRLQPMYQYRAGHTPMMSPLCIILSRRDPWAGTYFICRLWFRACTHQLRDALPSADVGRCH